MFLYLFHIWVTTILAVLPKQTKELCSQSNTSFNTGEKITYTIFYNVIGLYVNAGEAQFTIKPTKWEGEAAFAFTATGHSNRRYDWIFKVRDKYESIVDSKTLLPYFFSRSINEGSFHQNQTLTFNQKSKEVTTQKGLSFKAADCTFDVISAVYAVRNLDFSNLQVNEKVYLNFFLDNELFPSYFKYLGKEVVQTKFGKFKAIKIAPLLVKGSMFDGGERMTIWVTDDENHIPIRIETPIIVGSIKVDMKSYEGLRHPLSAKVEPNL
jgi:hypothetical protein